MFDFPKAYDVIVVGGGHAGVEAALAAARMGCQTLMLTLNLDTIGQMSCNPAIGGLAKGHLVREIDALGGEMGHATDLSGIQFRVLNAKKGPSVRAPRAQCDKKAYQFQIKWTCERQENLDIKQAQTIRLVRDGDTVRGVETKLGVRYLGGTVVVTTGTFLRGLMHVGQEQQSGGRAGEAAEMNLSASLKEVGLELGRLKTGTPPRLNRRSIDFEALELQPGDEPIPWFSFWHDDLFHVEHSVLEQVGHQLNCWITYTTAATAELVQRNLHLSPMYSGAIEGIGPRYCPSIEDKIVRFADKERHQIFLEPEGIATEEIYVNGFSTSLPYQVQVELVRTIIGCSHAEIMRPAYAVEYDFAFPTQLKPSLEAKSCHNLFLAGQINGTSGYEEAAAQGIMAGINAARRIQGLDAVVLRRDQAYIGVLIDDLVTKGTVEPYRMFTSRAEHRLQLRQDNADLRLCDLGHSMGLLPKSKHRKFSEKRTAIVEELSRLRQTRVGPQTLAQLLKRPEVSYWDLPGAKSDCPKPVAEQVEIEIKYEGYIQRQAIEIAKAQDIESKQIPDWLDYQTLSGLRNEAKQKLAAIRPMTLGQASRISGVTPADVAILAVWLKRGPQPAAVAKAVP